MRWTLPFVLALGAITTPLHAGLSREEAKMVASVDQNYEAMVSLLERLVNQNSGTMNFDGVDAVATMMKAELTPLGFAVKQRQRVAGRAGHLVARKSGKPGTKRLLLIAHLDTVFEPSSPFQKFTRTGDKAEGPGAGDDKGGMVVIVAALKAMAAAGTLKNAAIEIHMTGDEEDAGEPIEAARADLLEAAKRSDVALDFEGLTSENGMDMGSIARRSSNSWTLTTTGRAGHSSAIFSTRSGDGAVFEMVRILARFRQELPEPNLTFNVGLIVGGEAASLSEGGITGTAGGKTNIIPGTAIARGDFRTLSEEQTARVKARMAAIVAGHAPVTKATISFDPGAYPAMPPTEGNRALLNRLNLVNRDLGLPHMPILDPLKRGAGDISFVAHLIPGLVGLGVAGGGAHAPGETVDLNSIKRQAKRAAILMTRLAREKRSDLPSRIPPPPHHD